MNTLNGWGWHASLNTYTYYIRGQRVKLCIIFEGTTKGIFLDTGKRAESMLFAAAKCLK